MFFATIFFMVVKIFVKMLPHIPPMEIVFFRCLISFLITYYLLKRKGHNILGTNRSLLMMRGIFGTIGLYCYFVILQEIPLATASTLIYFTPFLPRGSFFTNWNAIILWTVFAFIFSRCIKLEK